MKANVEARASMAEETQRVKPDHFPQAAAINRTSFREHSLLSAQVAR